MLKAVIIRRLISTIKSVQINFKSLLSTELLFIVVLTSEILT